MPHKLPNNLKLIILRNKEMSGKSALGHKLVHKLLCINKFSTTAPKKFAKIDIKVSWFCPTLLNCLIFSKHFAQGCTNFGCHKAKTNGDKVINVCHVT